MLRFILFFLAALVTLASQAQAESLLEKLERIEREIEQHPAQFAAAESKVVVGEDVVTITATDLDNALDKIAEVNIEFPGRKFEVIVASPKMSKKLPLEGRQLATTDSSTELSLGKSVIEGFQESMDTLASEYPDLAKRIKNNPYDLRGHLDLAERKLGLDTIREGASLHERIYRVAWSERLSTCGRDVVVTYLSK